MIKMSQKIREYIANNPCNCGCDEIFAFDIESASLNEPIVCSNCNHRRLQNSVAGNCMKCGQDDPFVLKQNENRIICANCSQIEIAKQTRPSVYVSTSMLNIERAKQIVKKFEINNVLITYKWHKHGQLFDDSALADCAVLEVDGVLTCDVFFMVQPGRHGTHCELGIAIAANKPIVILDELNVEKQPFYYCKNVYRCDTEEKAFSQTLQLLKEKTNEWDIQ